jgi:peptidyl-prolyl cis-trans isomerase SurA
MHAINNGSLSRILVLVSLWGLIAPASAVLADVKVVDRVVAVVNDEVISLSEVELMVNSFKAQPGLGSRFSDERALQRQMLESLIDQKLAKVEAKRRGIEVTDKEMTIALDDFKKQNQLPDDAALTQALSKSNITLNELKQKIKDQIIQDRLMMVTVGAKVTLTDEEMRRFYEQQYPKTAGNRLHLQMIALPYPPGATQAQKDEVRQKAEIILKEHRQGVSLEELRKRHALLMQDMGFIAESDLAPELSSFLAKVKTGEVGPIETSQGFQLVQVVERRSGTARTFEEAKPEIHKILLRQKMGREFSEWLKGIREKAHIKIML